MVQYVLSLKATLEGVSKLQWTSSHKLLCIDVRHPIDPTDLREKIVVDFSDVEQPDETETHHYHHKQNHHHHLPKRHEKKQHHDKQKPFHHFHVQWSDGTKGTIRVVEVPIMMNDDDDDKPDGSDDRSSTIPPSTITSQVWFPILTLECDNVEPIRFYPLGKEFIVTNYQDKVYKEIDLSSNDWSEYDLASGSTSITNLESKFE